jgi:hypothetical protein
MFPTSRRTKVSASSTDEVRVLGRINQAGRRWVEVFYKDARAVVSLDEIVGRPNDAFGKINRAGILIVTDQSKRRFKEQVEQISQWYRISVADKRGWHNSCFVLSNDFVAAPAFATPPYVVLDDEEKWSARGTLADWHETAELLEGQRLFITCSSLAFVPPVLPLLNGFDNIAIELIWETSTGKSTLWGWVSSIWGGDPTRKTGFMENWLATPSGLEPIMGAHRHCLLPLDEANLAAASAPDRESRRQLFEVVFRLSQGVPKARYGDVSRPPADQLCWASSGNTSIIKRLRGIEPSELSAVMVRIITIPAQVTEQFGVFDRLPKGFADSGALINYLAKASTQFYGTPIRAFLLCLIQRQARFPRWVPNTVYRYIEAFVDATGIDRNDGPALRVARSFGLIYAAGKLAQLWGVLPSNWKIGWAVMACYQAHISQAAALQGYGGHMASRPALHGSEGSALNRILHYVRQHRDELFDLRGGKAKMDDATFRQAYGFLKPTGDGGLELLIPPWRMHREFPDYRSLNAGTTRSRSRAH